MMIGGAGWAVMAWRLAGIRNEYSERHPYPGQPLDRDLLARLDGGFERSREYYRIVDTAWRLWLGRDPVRARTYEL